MAQRRKKAKNGPGPKGRCAAGGKEPDKKKPRSRKARSERAPNGPEAPGAQVGTASPALDGTPPAPEPAGDGPRAPLPGKFYQRTGRWWWRVALPGEEKAKARPLTPEGAKTAAQDWETAEKTAFELWERAVQEHAARQAKLESTEKIERLKAQFLDKVRHFTELVETANAKVEAEAAARAEAEAKLAQIAHGMAPESPTQNSALGSPFQAMNHRQDADATGAPGLEPVRQTPKAGKQEAIPPTDTLPAAVQPPSRRLDTCAPQESAPGDSEQVERAERAALSGLIAPADDRKPRREQPAAREALAAPIEPQPVETGICECCGAAGIARACLQRIDSGQSLCPRCLTALRADIARIESPSSTGRSATE